MGILATTPSVAHTSSTSDDVKAGYVANEEMTLATSPALPAGTITWGVSKPSGSSSRARFSSAAADGPTFTPDVGGTYAFTATSSNGTVYILRCTVTNVAIASVAHAHRLSPVTDNSVPTPALGQSLFAGSDHGNALCTKNAAGLVDVIGGQGAVTVAQLPSAAANPRARYYVSDEAGGAQWCFSDGTNWRRDSDRAIATALSVDIIFQGQSNCGAAPPQPFGFSADTQYFGGDLLGWNHQTQSFTPVVDGSANARANYGAGATNLTAAKVWQVAAATSTFVDETTDFNSAANADVQLFPASEVVGDYVAIGFATKFPRVMFDYANGTAGVGGAVAWEYWNGTAWSALSGVADETLGLTAAAADSRQVSWTVPTDWASRDLNGSTQFYVRARVTTAYTTNPVLDQGFIGPASSTGSGPGLGQLGSRLCRRIIEEKGAGTIVRTFALARTGQPIDYFLPASVTLAQFEDGSAHPSLNNYNLMKSYVQASGRTPTLFVWVQGEADAGSSVTVYYNKLKTLFDQTRIDYPGIRWIIVGTIGTNVNTNTVFAAQKKLADENPGVVFFVDNRDMINASAYWSESTGPHYKTYLGYETVADRILSTLKGEAIEPVEVLDSIEDILAGGGVTIHRYQYSRAATSEVSSWHDTGSPAVHATGANLPAHVAYEPLIGGRSCVRFVGANSETLNATFAEDGATWSVWGVAKLSSLTPTQTLWELFSDGGGNRAGFQIAGLGNGQNLWYDAASQTFTGAPPFVDDWRTWGVAIDGPGLTARLYIDGALVSTIVIDGSENFTNPTLFIAALAGSAQFFTGDIAEIVVAHGTAMNAAQALAAHQYAKAEYQLPY